VTERHRWILERTRTKVALIYDLAAGELSHRALAAKHGVSGAGAIAEFKKKYRAEIDRQRADMANRFANLWIADKAARLAGYQDEAEVAEREIQKAVDDRLIIKADKPDPDDMEDGALEGDVSGPVSRYFRARDRALRSAAEELGQLPTRTTVALESTTIRHIIEGVDLDKL
jgi:hypothetical protein